MATKSKSIQRKKHHDLAVEAFKGLALLHVEIAVERRSTEGLTESALLE